MRKTIAIVHVQKPRAADVRSNDLARSLHGHEQEREVPARSGVLPLVAEHVAAQRHGRAAGRPTFVHLMVG